jgi:hypothetical protein
MPLTEQATRALEVVRRDGRDLRFEVTEICHAKRYRLSVHYRAASGDDVRLGLLYSTDRAALESVQAELSTPQEAASRGAR